jgi:tetratricopeptide (TPR) repeat protein
MSTTNDNPDEYGPYDWGNEDETLTLAKKITANEKGRAWFKHGLAWMLGYNFEEAIPCYQKAIAADANCAMAWWGIAYSVSSTYNWSPGLGCGYDAIQAAVGLKDKVSELEKDLIDALATRSTKEARDGADPTKLNFGNSPELNVLFAKEMAKVHAKYPNDNDVAAIYVEGLMNCKAWALWNKKSDGGGGFVITPADENTTTAQDVLETMFSTSPGAKRHPALCHLYCHLMELSPMPGAALPAADTLRTLMPSLGHLVHMPSHIDAWVGGYKPGVLCNIAGTEADDRYVDISGTESQFYKFYRMHNQHFVVWMAMHDGQYKVAMKYARKMQEQLTAEHVTFMLAGIIPMGAVFLESYTTMPFHVMIRFGKWDDILAEPVPTDEKVFPALIAHAHYARGVAYAAKGMVNQADEEYSKFQKAKLNPALAGRVLHNNPMYTDSGPCILNVADAMLRAEIAYRKAVISKADTAEFDAAFAIFREAIQLSEDLNYNEPWGWMVPIRHALGALLLEQGRVEEAEEVYRADIRLWQDNMWGLMGLKKCLEQRKKRRNSVPDMIDIQAKFESASSRADIPLEATCFCAAAAGAATEERCC